MEIAHDAVPWRPWSPAETADRLADVATPWAVTAGWALELFAGESWRQHEDIEVAVAATSFGEVHAALRGLELWVPIGGGLLRPFDLDRPERSGQTWVLDPAVDGWRLDVFREPSEGGTWICKRDTAIRMPYSELVERTAEGIPFVRPEVVLLFKAKQTRAKDEEDFEAVLPRLERGRRDWLRTTLERVHPRHRWQHSLR